MAEPDQLIEQAFEEKRIGNPQKWALLRHAVKRSERTCETYADADGTHHLQECPSTGDGAVGK